MPRVVDGDRRRAELTDAAARVIARSGPEAATMREVAREAGWTTGVLTHYFADKRALLLATYRASLADRQAANAEPAANPIDEVRRSLMVALPLDEDRRRHWLVTLACCTVAASDPELGTAQRDAYRLYRDHVAGAVAAAGLGGDPVAVAERLITIVDGVAVQALFDPESWPPDRQLDTVEALLPPPLRS
ncbi:MAG: TetR/AcrR family transcriptional regulator [Actinomycetota bacterium]